MSRITVEVKSCFCFLFIPLPPPPPPPLPVSLACIPFCDCQVGSVLTACTLYLLMTGDKMINRYEGQFS